MPGLLTCRPVPHNLADVKGEHKLKWARPSCGLSWLLRSSSLPLPALVGLDQAVTVQPGLSPSDDANAIAIASCSPQPPPPPPSCRRRPAPVVDVEPPGAEASAARVPDGEPLQREGAAGLHRIRRRMRRRHRRRTTHLPR